LGKYKRSPPVIYVKQLTDAKSIDSPEVDNPIKISKLTLFFKD
jgi:hypothetical protein